MGDAVVFLVGDGEGNRLVMFCHRLDGGVHPFSDQIDVVVFPWVVLLVADDCLAEGNGAVDL